MRLALTLALLLATTAFADGGLDRSLRFTLVLQNPTGLTVHDQRVLVYAPVAQTGAQELQSFTASAPHTMSTDALGNTIVEFRFDEVAPYSTHVIGIATTVRMRNQPLAARSDTTPFLRSDPLIDAADPEIARLATSLVRSEPREGVRAVYDWVRQHLAYGGYIMEDLGASYAVRHRRGDCTEYAYLVAALARANKLPARVMGGYVVDHDARPRAGEYHNWAEVYLEGAWQIVDAQREVIFAGAEQYVAFRILGTNAESPLGAAHRFRVFGELLARFE